MKVFCNATQSNTIIFKVNKLQHKQALLKYLMYNDLQHTILRSYQVNVLIDRLESQHIVLNSW